MRNKGFTLVELLVAVTIIMILGMAGIASYRVANQKARDAKRTSDLEQVRMALESYRETMGTYPGSASYGALSSVLTGTYISSFPNDPSGGTTTYIYNRKPDACAGTAASPCTGYELCADTESNVALGCLDYIVKSPL